MLTNKKKLSIITLGCQMNKHDSEWLAGVLADEYDYTEDQTEADLLVVNTCAVRDKAEHKFFSLMGRLRPLKKVKPRLIVGVAGCIAQEHGEYIVNREPLVDIVIGSRAVDKMPELLKKFEETGTPQIDVSDESGFDEFPMRRVGELSAWVAIMRGCDNHCSYCIVPQTRGPEQSRPAAAIIKEVGDLARRGYKEITLLGQNVNSYGVGLEHRVNFPELLRMAAEAVDGGARLRFVTSHPKDLSDELVDAMAEMDCVCPSLHLPIQSGSDRILALMRRGYTAEHYFSRVEKLRSKIPDLSLTADVIVGFPGETDDDFDATYRAVERAEYDNIYLFKYSPRPGTKAAELADRISPKLAQERFEAIMNMQKDITKRRYTAWVGRVVEVLVDGQSKRDVDRYGGRTPQNLVVNFDSDKNFTGQFIRVKIVKSGQYSLKGDIV